MSGLYDEDFVLWSKQQARLLRERASGSANATPDWENLAEEIESLGRSERRELARRISTILEALMNIVAHAPARERRVESALTILRERGRIEDLLDDSPSLRREVAEIICAEIASAREVALLLLDPRGEAPRADIATLDFDEAAVLTADLPPLG